MKGWVAVLWVVLFAGATNSVVADDIVRNAGEEYTFTVIAFPSEIASCHLKTPAEVTLDFVPGEVSEHANNYELEPINSMMPACSIKVKKLRKSDSGTWEIYYMSPTGISSKPRAFVVSVLGDDIHEEESSNNIEWLDTVQYTTRLNHVVDMSLSKIDHEEECFIKRPGEDYLRAVDFEIDEVTAHSRSNFVSCRITVGPMEETLLGEWTICGKHTANGEEHQRCQIFNLSWNVNNRPWENVNRDGFDHPVHFGSTLSPSVSGTGRVLTCHAITPNGEDLIISNDSEYPFLRARNNNANAVCNIIIGPINEDLLGNWTIYGRFRDLVGDVHEVHLPISLYLYDEEHPYNQAYNVTNMDPLIRVVPPGAIFDVGVSRSGRVDNCSFVTPSGENFNLKTETEFQGASFVNNTDSISCVLKIGPITEDLFGEWQIIGKFSSNGRFTELRQTVHVYEEDPENPVEENRVVQNLTRIVFDTEIGKSHRVIINVRDFIENENCHIRTPSGLQYKVIEGFNVSGVEIIKEPEVECGVRINVKSEDMIGDWILIARAKRFWEPIERRLPFTINVEEILVEAYSKKVVIEEGEDLYVRLRNPTEQYESCKLINPFGRECATAERDPQHVATCGFIKKDMQTFNNGTWQIVYGNNTIYRAHIDVNVTASSNTVTTVNLSRDRPVNVTIGPHNAIYCRLQDPQGIVVYDAFTACRLSLEKVTLEHQGIWKMVIGMSEQIVTEEQELSVNVIEEDGKLLVSTLVTTDKPSVNLTCALPSGIEVNGCKFRDPQGRVLLARKAPFRKNKQKKKKNRYPGMQQSEEESEEEEEEDVYEADVFSNQCSIQLNDPEIRELGLWRCTVETRNSVHYGFLSVLCPWALSVPEIAAMVQQEPVLKASRSLVSAVEGESLAMSCAVESAIRYCYFRAANGSTYSVSPNLRSSNMEYVGVGFDGGDCSVKFHDVKESDSGLWGCHVGLIGNNEEQKDYFQLAIHQRMTVSHRIEHGDVMVVEGIVYKGRSLEYCRFVRIDGLGFTSANIPEQYSMTGIMANGECRLSIRNYSVLDRHPWTVVAKIRGQDVEISKDTMETIIISPPATPETELEPTPESEEQIPDPDHGHEPKPKPDHGHGPRPRPPVIVVNDNNEFRIFFYLLLSVTLVALMMSAILVPKRNRQWTFDRASSIRSSFQHKFGKQPQPELPQKA